MHGVNEPWMPGVWLELLPQPCNGVIDRAGDRRIGVRPDLTQELVSGHDVSLSLREVLQHVELAVAEMHRLSAVRRVQRLEINRDGSEDELIRPRPGTPQHSG